MARMVNWGVLGAANIATEPLLIVPPLIPAHWAGGEPRVQGWLSRGTGAGRTSVWPERRCRNRSHPSDPVPSTGLDCRLRLTHRVIRTPRHLIQWCLTPPAAGPAATRRAGHPSGGCRRIDATEGCACGVSGAVSD